MEVAELKLEMDKRFEQVDKRFDQVDKRFEQVEQNMEDLRRHITEEGEKTRRHFDIAVEHMCAERNLCLDVSKASAEQLLRHIALNAGDHAAIEKRLDDHERRLFRLEHS